MSWRVIGLSFGLWFLTGLPVLTGFLSAKSEQVYVARITIVAADTTAYYSNIEQARQGRMLFANQFTSEVQRPSLLHPLWLVTGWIANALHLATPWAYQLIRLLAVGWFVWLLDRIVRTLWVDNRAQWIALLLVTTSSGLGWLIAPGSLENPLKISPDRWVAESNTFQSIGHSALFIGSQALMLQWLWAFYRWSVGQIKRLPWWLGPAAGALLLMHPYDVITLGAICVAWIGYQAWCQQWTRTHLRSAVLLSIQLAGWAALAGWYYFGNVLREPAMSGWLAQNRDISPNPLLVLVGYGLLVPFAVWGAIQFRKRSVVAWLSVWAIANFLIIYAPIDFQRRLLSGLHIPVALLASYGVITFWRLGALPRVRHWVVAGILLVLAITNGKSLTTDIAIHIEPRSVNFPVYISRDENAAMQVLKNRTDFSDIVFSEVWTGNTIPGLIGRTVAVGHGHQTLELQPRLRDWLAFTKNELTQTERAKMLARLRITWLYWRDRDNRPNGYRPENDPRWSREFQNDTVQLYQLKLDSSE